MANSKPVQTNEVAILGAAAVDWVAHVVELPQRDHSTWAESFTSYPGGSGGNIAAAVARMGKGAIFLGKLGDDDGGRLLWQAFVEAGVDTAGIRVIEGQRSASCFIAVDKAGDRQIYCLGGTALYEHPVELEAAWLAGVRILVISDAFPGVAEAAIGRLDRSARVVFNPSGWMASLPVEQLRPLLASSQVLIVSRHEAEQLTGLCNAEESTCSLAACGSQIVIQTLGACGSLLWDGDQLHHIPIFPAEQVVDTTGAGDAFTAGVILGILEGLAWPEAARLGSITAAINAGSFGARGGLPNWEQVKKLMQVENITMNEEGR